MSYKYLGREFVENETIEKINQLLDEIQTSHEFKIIHQTKGAAIFKIL
jgi:hypothetical protein